MNRTDKGADPVGILDAPSAFNATADVNSPRLDMPNGTSYMLLAQATNQNDLMLYFF
jgi:hypothetical protein